MKHLASILLFIFIATRSFAAIEEQVIHSVAKNVKGHPSIRDGKFSKPWIPITNGTVIKEGDMIRTSKNSSLEIHFEDESVMTVMPDAFVAAQRLRFNMNPGPNEPVYQSEFQIVGGEVKASVSKTPGVLKKFELTANFVPPVLIDEGATKGVRYFSSTNKIDVETLDEPVIVQSPENARKPVEARQKIIDDRKAAEAQKREEARREEARKEEARKAEEAIKREEARKREEALKAKEALKAAEDQEIKGSSDGEDYRSPVVLPGTAKTETKNKLGYAFLTNKHNHAMRITDGTIFRPGDIIYTGPGSYFDMHLEDGSVLTVTSMTVMKVDEIAVNPNPGPNEPKYQMKFKLRAGEVKASASKQEGVLKTFEVETPRGTVSIDDATKRVNYSPKGGMQVSTLQGSIFKEAPKTKEAPTTRRERKPLPGILGGMEALVNMPVTINKLASALNKKLKYIQARQKLIKDFENAAEVVEKRYAEVRSELLERITPRETEETRENLQEQINNRWDINRRWNLSSLSCNVNNRIAPTRTAADLMSQAVQDLRAFQMDFDGQVIGDVEVYSMSNVEAALETIRPRSNEDPLELLRGIRTGRFLSRGENISPRERALLLNLLRHLHEGQVLARRGLPVTRGEEELAGLEFLLQIIYAEEYERDILGKAEALDKDFKENKENLIKSYQAQLLKAHQAEFEKEFEEQMQGKGNASPEIQQLININKLVAGL